ncbi:unnamed protein product, partial [Meganyctiphanes norvegica]
MSGTVSIYQSPVPGGQGTAVERGGMYQGATWNGYPKLTIQKFKDRKIFRNKRGRMGIISYPESTMYREAPPASGGGGGAPVFWVVPPSLVEGPSVPRSKKMDRLRRSFRDSFRKKKDSHVPESSKPHQWQTDESSVRAGTCQFNVKYLGCVEVFESRGMQVCEEALKVLRQSRRRPLRGVLYVSGDGLRVVDDETKGLIVDQTIEKVSFCAPDRNHEKGFSYICRDGTTRRWMCHGFVAVRETGERLSHAVGCAFASCLERKQKRDKECGVTMNFDPATSTFTRTGSFRQMTVTERLQDPQECKPIEPIPVKPVVNPHAVARPHATTHMLQKQGSFRGFSHLQQSSPFKRQLSLKLSELPSNLERTRSMSLDNAAALNTNNNIQPPESPQPPPRAQRGRLASLPNAVNMTPIPESSPMVENKNTDDAVSAMCAELSHGLSLLSNFPDPFGTNSTSPTALPTAVTTTGTTTSATHITTNNSPFNIITTSQLPPVSLQVLVPSVAPIIEENPWEESNTLSNGKGADSESASSGPDSGGWSRGEEWLSQINASSPLGINTNRDEISTPSPPILGVPAPTSSVGVVQPMRRAPPMNQLRSQSLGNPPPSHSPFPSPGDPMTNSWSNTNGTTTNSNGINGLTGNNIFGVGANRGPQSITNSGDPFDAEWAALAARNANPNNPFLQTNNVTKAFEVQMV